MNFLKVLFAKKGGHKKVAVIAIKGAGLHSASLAIPTLHVSVGFELSHGLACGCIQNQPLWSHTKKVSVKFTRTANHEIFSPRK